MIEYDFPLVQMLLEVGFEFLEKKRIVETRIWRGGKESILDLEKRKTISSVPRSLERCPNGTTRPMISSVAK